MNRLGSLATVGRGLTSRAGSALMVLIVAIVAIAAASTGPTYYDAAKTSILRDTASAGPVLNRGIEVVQSGDVNSLLDPLQAEVTAAISPAADVFQAPIQALEATAFDPRSQETLDLVWRTSVCAHLQITGACPDAAGQVIISQSLAQVNHWRVGQQVVLPTWGRLTITGTYAVPLGSSDYWFTRAPTYFPYESPVSPGERAMTPSDLDALFTVQATIVRAPASAQGNAVVDDPLDVARLPTSAVGGLVTTINDLVSSPQLAEQQAVVTTDIVTTLAQVQSGWSSLAIPVLIVILQLVGLSWLLLLLLVSEGVSARGSEVALAKLRGRGRWRTLSFGLSEPVALLAVALPVGVLAGWGASILLGRARFRPGTAVGLPGLAWAAAVVATAGGLTAVFIASRRTFRRPVIEQWRRANTGVHDRSWVVDALLLTGAVAALMELWLSGTITAAHHSALSLLVPGLLGVAIAVVASRALPLICRAVMAHPGRSGLASFLALRHIARRPSGARTTIMLATSFALATFGLAAFGVDQVNDRSVANTDVGAPTVLTVGVPVGQGLGALVSRADPTGTRASPVEFYGSGESTTLAVDPRSWIRIASFPSGTSKSAIERLAAELDPPAPPPLVLTGDAIRVHLQVGRLEPSSVEITVDVVTTDGTAPTPVSLGALPAQGPATLTGSLVSCPCRVQDITLTPRPTGTGSPRTSGSVDVEGVQVHGPRGWQSVDAGFSRAGRWGSGDQGARDTLITGQDGLTWAFDLPSGPATLRSVNRPDRLPAVAASSVASRPGPTDATGLDGQNLPVQIERTFPAIPSAPSGAVVVDQQYAEIAAGGDLASDVQQVWLATGADAEVVPRLTSEGITILSTKTEGGERASLDREGPGLARVLFLAEAVVAALLAAAGAVLGLYLLGRRRRFELAALLATGVRHRTLLTAVAAEQLIVVAFGAAVGVATGLVAAAVALGDIPEFQSPPGIPLDSFPPAGALIAVLALGVALVVVASLGASVSLLRGVQLEQLREAPS